MIDFASPRIVDAGGVLLAVYEEGSGPPVILVHGWPEIAYSWKPVFPALAAAGYRAIALDLKGFGRSAAPPLKNLYDICTLTGDLAALLDALEIERAVFCGHDWGGAIVWAMAQLRPERVAGVISLCTPLRPRPPVPPLKIIEKRFTDRHYFIRFQEEDAPEQLFETDIERFFRLVFQKPAPRERWAALIPGVYDLLSRFQRGQTPETGDLVLTEEDLKVYVDAYRRSGFRGGINIYRNVDRNWALMEGRDETVRAPALWIGAELDLFLPPEGAEGMESLVFDLDKHVLSGCGHWMTWEKPDEAAALIVDWLKRRYF
ncbi:MAG: alpha/beta fold hydrolase [Parvularculaceae bacterium]